MQKLWDFDIHLKKRRGFIFQFGIFEYTYNIRRMCIFSIYASLTHSQIKEFENLQNVSFGTLK